MNVTVLTGIAGSTLEISSDNTSNSLVTDGSLPMSASLGGQTNAGIIACLITLEDNQIRFAHGVNATATHGHVLFVGQSLLLENPATIRSFRYISDTAGSHGKMMVTPYYGRLSAK